MLAAVLLLVLLTAFGAGAQTDGDPERGGDLYVTYCAMCHGLDGRGRVGANLENFPGIQVEAAMAQIIANGISGSTMPAWSTERGGPLTDQDIQDIVVYLNTILGGTAPIAPAPTYQAPVIEPLPDIEGDPSRGAVVFQTNCIACHGEAAQGVIGKNLAKSWPGNQPDIFIRDVTARGISGSVMPAWGKEFGGPLSDGEVADVTSYILTLSPTAQLPTLEDTTEGPLNLSLSLVIFAVLLIAGIVIAIQYFRKA